MNDYATVATARTCHGHLPLLWFQRLTAKLWLHVMVTTAGCGDCGCVLAATCVTGELDRNFMIMQTSSCKVVNIFGDCDDNTPRYHTVHQKQQ